MTSPPTTTGSLAGILHARALSDPDRVALTAVDQHGTVTCSLTTGELDAAARSLAARLLDNAVPGDRVLLPPMPDLRFQVAFMACLYAGLVAVPLPPVLDAAVDRRQHANRSGRRTRLLGVRTDALPAAIVVPADRAEELAGDADLRGLRMIPAAHPAELVRQPDGAHRCPAAGASPDALAFLQYTSGSTSSPRGVMIGNRAILANQCALFERMGITARFSLVSWLPMYHDMGLCLGLLLPVYAGVPATMLEPETFLVRPEAWLRAMSGRPDVGSAAPDFAYRWCARRVKDSAKAGLDLTGWRVAVSGAEPVRAQTLREFHAAFAGYGLRSRALTPSYGLAEATLFVTGGPVHTEPVIRSYRRAALTTGSAVTDSAGPELVGCGTPGRDIEVAIVDPDTGCRRPDRQVGEVWVRSPAAGVGYWGRPAESRATFGAVLDAEPDLPWLRTGDLGFLDAGELFVTGRRKEMIVIAGANYYPHDFELLAQQAHPLLDGGLAAAVAVDGQNRVTIMVEAVRRPHDDEAVAAATAAVQAVTAVLPVAVDVVVTGRGRLARTTSGKVRRGESAERLRTGQISPLARWPRALPASASTVSGSPVSG